MEDLGVFLKNFDTNDDNRINEAVEILGPQFSRRYCNKSSRVLGLVNFAEANGGLDSFDFANFFYSRNKNEARQTISQFDVQTNHQSFHLGNEFHGNGTETAQ